MSFVAELLACFCACEPPVDGDAVAVHLAVPGLGFPSKLAERRDSASAQTLAAEQADLDLRLVEPASVFGRVMHGEPVPQPAADLFSEALHDGLAAVRTQIVQHQMDGTGSGVMLGNLQEEIGELGRRARGRHLGEMNPRLRLNPAEDVGGAATLVLRVAPQDSPWALGPRRTQFGMQNNRLLINANHGFTLCSGFS